MPVGVSTRYDLGELVACSPSEVIQTGGIVRNEIGLSVSVPLVKIPFLSGFELLVLFPEFLRVRPCQLYAVW